MESICAKILQVAMVFKHDLLDDELSKTLKRLEDLLFSIARSSNTSVRPTRIVKIYIRLLPEQPHPIHAMEMLLRSSSIDPVAKGNILVALAYHAKWYGLDVERYLVDAEDYYRPYEVGDALLEIEIIRISRLSETQPRTIGLHRLMDMSIEKRLNRLAMTAYLDIRSFVSAMESNNDTISMELLEDAETKIIQSLCTTGQRLMWSLVINYRLMSKNRLGRYGQVIECQSLFESGMMPIEPSIRHGFSTAMAAAYASLGNAQEYSTWMERAIKYSNQTNSTEEISETKQFATNFRDLVNMDDIGDQTALYLTTDLETRFNDIQSDRKIGLFKQAFDKICQLISYYVIPRTFPPINPKTLQRYLEEAEDLAKRHPDVEGALHEFTYYRIYAQLQSCGLINADADKLALEEAVDFHKRRPELRNGAGRALWLISCIHLHEWFKSHDTKHLIQARNWGHQAVESYEAYGCHLAASMHCRLGEIYGILARAESSSRMEHYVQSLKHLDSAALICDRQRYEITLNEDLDTLLNKQLVTDRSLRRRIYRQALFSAGSGGLWDDMWNWIQRNKARSMSELLGMSIIVPSHLEEKIRESPNIVRDLLDEELRLVESLRSETLELRARCRAQLDAHHREMEKHPVLNELLALKQAKSERIDGLDWLFCSEKVNNRVLVVDWIILEDQICVTVLSESRKPYFQLLGNSMEALGTTIDKWREDVLRGVPVDTSEFDFLVAPLLSLQAVRPGDLLILSPSGPLHRLPMHALRLPNGEILIERHPIVYCHNLAILRQCSTRTINRLTVGSANAVFIGVYPDENKEIERANIEAEISRYSEMFGGTVLLGEKGTKANFKPLVRDAALIHFHGHCTPNNSDILQQSLELSLGVPETIQTTCPPRDSNLPFVELWRDRDDLELEWEPIPPRQTDPLSVQELFSISLNAPVVTLIACGSARQCTKPGDEPLGLVSGFLYAGAKCVLGTLWDTYIESARVFSGLFYDHIYQQMRGAANPNDLINLAIAIQHAVLKVRENPDWTHVYHWAPFVLYGSWMVPPFWADVARNARS